MSVNEEFLDNQLEDGVMSLVLQFTDKLPLRATEIGYEVIAEQQQMLVKAILQHFQQEQESSKLQARLEELGEIQLIHGRQYTVTHINGEPQLIRDRISELNSLLFDLRRDELSNSPKEQRGDE